MRDRPYFIGPLNWAPQVPEEPSMWQLEEPYALVYGHYFIFLTPWHKTDGASIPWMLQLLLGHPFKKDNKFWAVFHDGGYNGWAIVVDLHTTECSPDELFSLGVDGKLVEYQIDEWPDRRWWDRMARDGSMVAADSPRWKRRLVYTGLRIFGGRSWRRDKDLRNHNLADTG